MFDYIEELLNQGKNNRDNMILPPQPHPWERGREENVFEYGVKSPTIEDLLVMEPGEDLYEDVKRKDDLSPGSDRKEPVNSKENYENRDSGYIVKNRSVIEPGEYGKREDIKEDSEIPVSSINRKNIEPIKPGEDTRGRQKIKQDDVKKNYDEKTPEHLKQRDDETGHHKQDNIKDTPAFIKHEYSIGSSRIKEEESITNILLPKDKGSGKEINYEKDNIKEGVEIPSGEDIESKEVKKINKDIMYENSYPVESKYIDKLKKEKKRGINKTVFLNNVPEIKTVFAPSRPEMKNRNRPIAGVEIGKIVVEIVKSEKKPDRPDHISSIRKSSYQKGNNRKSTSRFPFGLGQM